MLPEEIRNRQKRLEEIILGLSEAMVGRDSYEQYLNQLNSLYQDNFKHQYSNFFPIILKILEEDNAYDIDYLSNNLIALETYLDELTLQGNITFNSMYTPFIKLCDHLDLQIRQTNYYKSMLQKSSDASQALQDAQKQLTEATKGIDDATKRANTMQTELISILSIFAAIVITLSGGFTFLGNSLTAISNAKYYESIIIIAIICGMVLFNTIFLMMFFVAKLTERNIFSPCTEDDCSKCARKCHWLKRLSLRLPYVFYFNIMAIIGIVFDLIIWTLDIYGIIK